MGEEWRPVRGHEGHYEVSSLGRVRSVARISSGKAFAGKVLSQITNQKGYKKVNLWVDKQRTTRFVHRVVAEAFLEGDGETVNHKDGDKTHNAASNLEWATNRQNVHHALAAGLHPWKTKPVLGVGPLGEGLFLATVNLSAAYGFSPSSVSSVALGKALHHKNWKWSYYA